MISSCRKPEDNIGLEVLDPADALGVLQTDTTSILAYSVRDDSVRTSGLSRNMIGSFNDPNFGLVNTSSYFQVRLSTNNVGDGIDPSVLVVDSIVLALEYEETDPFYGNLHQQELIVFEMAESIRFDTSYYSKDAIGVYPIDLVETKKNRFVPDPYSGVVVGEDTLEPQLRIKLKDEFGRRLLDMWGTPELENNDNFLEYFKGFHVLTNNGMQAPNQGAALNFDLLDANSKLTLYYRDTTMGSEDTLAYDFEITDQSARFSRVEQIYGQAIWPIVQGHLDDPSTGQTEYYLQSGGGLRAILELPHLMDYNDSLELAIAKAELIIPVEDPFIEAWSVPTSLFIFRKSESGGDVFLPDQFELTNPIGGMYDGNKREYRFNISRYIQQVLNGTLENDGLHLVAANRGVSVARAQFKGPEALDRPTRLIITFTEL